MYAKYFESVLFVGKIQQMFCSTSNSFELNN